MTVSEASPEAKLQKCQDLVRQLNDNCRDYRLKIQALEGRLGKAEEKAEHFDILLGAVKENPVVKGAWDKFMMALRMTGYDGTK